MTNLSPTETRELSRLEKLVAEMRSKINEYVALSDWLIKNRAIAEGDPALEKKVDSLIEESANISALIRRADTAVTNVRSALDNFRDWVGGIFTLGDLGIAPIIVIPAAAATVAGSIAAMTKWITDAQAAKRRMEFINAQVERGASLPDAQRAADGAASIGGAVAEAGSLVRWGLAGAALYFGAKYFGFIK